MNYFIKSTVSIILSLCIIFISFVPADSAEIDDSTVFVEAFNAYQQKDYLLAIEKCDQLNQIFPDSPLRDVTLLLTARASLKAGNNERAAKSAVLFSTEFPESSLKSSVEEELKTLANRLQKGEILPVDKSMQTAAAKVRTEALARERAAKLKLETELAAKAKAEQERLARIKLEEELREKERLQAEKLAKASIRATVTVHEDTRQIAVGSSGRVPIEIANTGKNSEDFLLMVSTDKAFEAVLVKENKPDDNITRLQLAAGETFKGSVALKMPINMVDGHRTPLTIKVVSAKFSDISFQKESIVISSAPLVRAVAKLAKQKVMQGEILRYRVSVLNVGSLTAQNVIIRLLLPSQIEFKGTADVPFKRESDGKLVFNVEQIEIGKLAEINLEVKIREDSSVGQELRGQVEIVNSRLQRKELFTAGVSIVQGK